MKDKRLILLTAILSVLAGMIMSFVNVTEEGVTCFEELFDAVYGYVDFSRYDALAISSAKWMLPQMVLFLVWGDYIETNLIGCLDYIRTRTSSTQIYMISAAGRLMGAVLVSCFILFLITSFSASIQGVAIQILPASGRMLSGFLYLSIMLIAVNLFSVCMKAGYAVGLVLGVQLVMLGMVKLILEGVVNQNLYKVLPVSQNLFYYKEKLPELQDFQGLMFLLLILLCEMIFAVIWLKKREGL